MLGSAVSTSSLKKKRTCGWRKRSWIWRLVEPIMGTPRGQFDPPRQVVGLLETIIALRPSRVLSKVWPEQLRLHSLLVDQIHLLPEQNQFMWIPDMAIWSYGSTFSCAKILHPLWSQLLYAIKFFHCRTGCLHHVFCWVSHSYCWRKSPHVCCARYSLKMLLANPSRGMANRGSRKIFIANNWQLTALHPL